MFSTSLPRLLVRLSILVLLACVGVSSAVAAAVVPNRINAPVTNRTYTQVPGSIHPKARLASDLGPAPASNKLEMSIRFSRTADQEAALQQLLADQQNPSSPRYHQWLTPTEFGTEFGLSSSDIAKVTAWLTGQGFTVTGVANGGAFISFEGTVAQAQTAFATSIHDVMLNGDTHYANITDISVPYSLGGVVSAVTGLHNFRLQPHLKTSVTRPDFTSAVSGNHYLAPGDIYTIYNVSSALQSSGGAGIGTGANCHSMPSTATCGDIAVLGQVDIYAADVTAFRTASGLNAGILPTTVHEGADPGPPVCTSCTTGPNQSDLGESSIDVEWSGAMAPTASILFVNGVDIYTNSMTQAIDQNLAPIVTTSYGACEAGWGANEIAAMNALFEQANAQGQTILAASADVGATDCDGGPSATEGLAVDFPASSPYVTGMGGTQFTGDAAPTCVSGSCNGTTASNYAATTYWAGTPSSSDVIASALSYIPESVWNDINLGSFGAGGGGASNYFIKPTWQTGTGIPADAARDVPDLALDGSDSHDAFLYCANVAQGLSCTNGYRLANNNLNVAGGTSFDSQIFGGMLALVEKKLGSRIGNANPEIYALANSSTYYNPGSVSSIANQYVFNDVTQGDNAMPCSQGTVSCPNGGTAGYSAGTGYDTATGWGSVNVANLAAHWGAVTPLGVGSLGANTSTTALCANGLCLTAGSSVLTSVTLGSTVTLMATVTGSAATPTGTVQFLANNVALGSPVALMNGVANYAWVTSCSNYPEADMTASYSGDAIYQGSRGPGLTSGGATQNATGFVVSPIRVLVTGTCPDFTSAPASTSITVAAGGSIPALTVNVTPTNGFTGTVVFTGVPTSSTTGYVPTLSFSPSTLTFTNATAQSTQMSFTGITADLRMPAAPGKADSGTMLARQSPARTWLATGSGVTIASLLLFVMPRRRRLGGLLALALAVALVGGATGCGGSSSSAPPSSGTGNTNPYVGTYGVNVVATYRSPGGQVIVHSSAITYTIN